MVIRRGTTPARRALRVRVFLGAQLVEEQLFVGEPAVRIGRSLRCELSLPVDALPQVHALFVSDHGQRQLRVTAAMRGELADGATVRTELQGGASDGGVWTWPIARGGHGRLEVGEATIVFAEIAAPAVAPRVPLPAAMQRTLGERIDRRLAAIVGASLLAHLAIGTWASLVDREVAAPPADHEAGEYHHSSVIDDPVFPAPPPAAPPIAPGIAAPPRPNVPPPASVAPRTHPIPRARPPMTPSPPPMTREAAERLAHVLAGGGEDPRGPGGMARHKPVRDLERELAALRDGTVEIGDSGRLRPATEPQLGTRPGTFVDGPAFEETPRKAEQPVRIVPRPLPGGPAPTTLTADQVLAKLQRHYLAGLQRCYRKALLDDAALAGTLKLTFTVDDRGRVVDGVASGLAGVAPCVEAQMSGWRFATPRDPAGDAADADFGISLAMQPS